MPNWCSNSIVIGGSKETIRMIKNKLENSENGLIFSTLIGPCPDEFKGEDFPNSHWFGTKWDVEIDDSIEYYDTTISLSISTAWSPPIKFLRKLNELYGVSYEILYSEPGNNFCGKEVMDEVGNGDSSIYSYLEGLYTYDEEQWEQELNNLMDYFTNEYDSFDEMMKKQLPFITNLDDIEIVRKIYLDYKKEE